MRIEEDIKLDFKDVLIRPKRSTLRSRSEVELVREFKFPHANKVWQGVPMIAANMDHTGTFEVAKVLAKHQMMTAIDKFRTVEDWEMMKQHHPEALNFAFVSSGTRDDDFNKLADVLRKTGAEFICLDVANGYSQHFVDFVKRTRDAFPDKIIMAGNVVTGEMTEELILSGADIVKAGIGPGSVCTTRKKTGVGYPQLSAVIECADAAHGLKGLVCSDGGCTVPGDVSKAFAAGADFVMLGGMFAGHDECLGEVIEENGQRFKRFYGMSSAEAMTKHRGGVAEYRASEGKSVNVPYRGPIEETVLDILGGVRSTCTYVGASSLKELSKRTTFVRVSQQLNEVFNPHHVSG
ncbi:MAG: GMP reductase [Gammaproteobacteria bacterium CG11_big_fil_rev_8_21_14_0_20_46_22]|nr:MAG: GMP reductase [Gammaproteobacteria bacterium CG12_big_fil_rev_8_21_14_0_65_46_12]PIR11540.1 MAG: GMP reductase [Gammaproteobacteria bacterium CG11_big_fil_rev_8_21_14_0_20_46_22]